MLLSLIDDYHPGQRVVISGFADPSGTPQFNQNLSAMRAEHVAQFLRRHGVRREDIVISSFGESQPLLTRHSRSNLWQERRVELNLTGSTQP